MPNTIGSVRITIEKVNKSKSDDENEYTHRMIIQPSDIKIPCNCIDGYDKIEFPWSDEIGNEVWNWLWEYHLIYAPCHSRQVLLFRPIRELSTSWPCELLNKVNKNHDRFPLTSGPPPLDVGVSWAAHRVSSVLFLCTVAEVNVDNINFRLMEEILRFLWERDKRK